MQKIERNEQMKKVISVVVLIGTLLNLCCCGNSSTNDNQRKIIDCAGDEVYVPQEIDEVINLVAFGCQGMVGLGLGDYLVGINDETVESAWIEEMYPRINCLQPRSQINIKHKKELLTSYVVCFNTMWKKFLSVEKVFQMNQ